MRRHPVLMISLIAALGACGTLPATPPQPMTISPAPVTVDGNVAAQPTDYVFVLISDADPSVPGLALKSGESLRLRLPAAFDRNESVDVRPDADTNLVLTRGWPQGAVKRAGPYRIGYDRDAQAMTVTATADIAATGPNAPRIKAIHLRGSLIGPTGDHNRAGAPRIKAIHLRGSTFLNPFPGTYGAAVEHRAVDGRVLAAWSGSIEVRGEAPTARLAPTNFHLPPGTGADFQKAAPGQVMAHRRALL